jgi:hypothetical protein
MAFKIAPSNSQIISCLNFIWIPTQVVISKPDSNFKYGPTMNSNGRKMEWMMMLELLSLGLSFLQVCLEIHIVAMYVECRSLKAWHNTSSQILRRVGHFQS